MLWKSTDDRYGAVAIAIHWTTAVAIVGILASGFQAADAMEAADRLVLLRIHATLGIFVVLLTLMRIGWWWLGDAKPADAAGTPRWQARAAHIVHGLLYVIILGMGASGIGMLALSGAGATLFAGATTPLPDFTTYLPRAPHGLGSRLLIALLAFHTAAALYHHFVMRDGLLGRMGLGR